MFVGAYRMTVQAAWEAFGERNGVGSADDLRAAVARYRADPLARDDDPQIGCVALRDVSFWPPGLVQPAPDDFARSIVRGKGYELAREGGSPLEAAVATLIDRAPAGVPRDHVLESVDLGPTRGGRRLVPIRLGQGSFRAAIDLAYGGKCVVTGNHVRPVLQAAHIRPVEKDGVHRVDNGLLLRADVHLMFDRGYLGVHPERRTLEVSPRLRSEFGNGDEFYARAGDGISVPSSAADRPNAEFLTWHMDQVFQR